MINREDMLELTRRMTPSRTCFDRIAGAYINDLGEVDESFNVHFGKLSGAEKSRNLALAKAIPFSKTNVQLKEYIFSENAKGKESMYTLLRAIQQCGLKNDALMELLYEQIADFIICTVSPMAGQYEPAEPVFGFIYPAFSDRSADEDRIDIFHANPESVEKGLMYKLL